MKILIYVVLIMTLLRATAVIAILIRSPIRSFIGAYFLFILTVLLGYLVNVYQEELRTTFYLWVKVSFGLFFAVILTSPYAIRKFTEFTSLLMDIRFFAKQSSLVSTIFSVTLFILIL